MVETQLPVDILSWLMALLPIIVLLVLLVGLGWTAPQAGSLGMFVAAGVALFVFRTPIETLAVATGKGIWDAIFILYVIWPALWLYQVTDRAGGYDALRQGMTRFSRNELFIVIAIGWVFSSFLQGVAGFGAPIAIVAPLLVAMGVKPIFAVVIPIIAHIWAKVFGTLAAGWLATLQVVNLEDPQLAAVQTAVLLIIPTLLGGFTVAWLYGRWAAIAHAWPLILIIGGIQSIAQILIMYIDPVMSAFLAAALALVALYPLSRWQRYNEPAEGITERPAMRSDAPQTVDEKAPTMGLALSFLPYVLLTGLAVVALMIGPVQEWLEQVQVGMPFPAVTTGYGIENEAADPYSPFAPLTHPGTLLIVSTVVTWLVYRMRGFYQAWKSDDDRTIFQGLINDAVPSSMPIIAFLVMAKIMDHSGMNLVLALGIAAIAPPLVFAFLSNAIGALGAFMTSSSTSSNVLFSGLQQTVAELNELPESTIIAAQSAGGAIGNAIAPANVVMGASTAGIRGQEGKILRHTIPWTIAAVVLTGFATILMVVLS